MTTNYLIATFFLVTALFGLREKETTDALSSLDWSNNLAMCHDAGTEPAGRCLGKANCTACTNCSRCAYCNSGGSCGVCAVPVFRAPAPKRSYSPTPRTRKSTPRPSPKPKPKVEPPPSTSFIGTPAQDPPSIANTAAAADTYTVLQATSLRASPDAQAKVLLRFKAGDEVLLVDSPTGFWWKVDRRGKTGWVKKALLRKD